TVIDDYLFRFILDEVKLKKLDDVRNWQKMLCGLIETLPECGMPMDAQIRLRILRNNVSIVG
ncbi:MAG: hypothetical protein ACK58Z_19750, partial [Pseudanabaena sp.]